MRQSKQGNGQVALISGEAGIGKSRLVKEAKARSSKETLILEGYCFQTESALPYAPLLDLFRNYFTMHSSQEIADVLGSSGGQLVKLFPELTGYLPHLTFTPNPDPKQEKQYLFQALVQTLTELAQHSSLIIVVEDLHWSDSTSLEFLLLLARRISLQPILVLVTYRSDEITAELSQFLAELNRQRLGVEFALKPMTPPELDAMVRTVLGMSTPISREFLDTIFPLTEGNPFFVEEILKALIAEGDIFYANGIWDRKEINQLRIPRTIKDAVQRRTQHLDEQTRQALTLASVMGRRFDFRLLQDLLQVNEANLMAMLKELIAAQLVLEETADHFVFRHALTREAIYTALLLRERQMLHCSVAEAIERVYAASTESRMADLSFHYYTGGIWEKALEYSRRAGDQAGTFYAQREAVVYYSRAIDAARQLGIVIAPELLIARGRAYDILGDFPSALDDLEGARNTAREQGDGQAEWQALIDLGFLWSGRDYEQSGEFHRQAEELARKLNQPKLLAHSLNRVGNWFFITGQTTQALEYHRRALKFFEAEQDQRGMAESRNELGMAMLHHGDQIGSYQEYQHAIRLFRKLDDKQGLIDALAGACHTLYDDTDFIPPQSRLENQQMGMEALELARQSGWTWGEAFVEWVIAIGLSHWGRFEEALTHAQVAFQIAAEVNHPQQLAGGYYALGYTYVLMLQADLAIQNLEAGLTLIKEFGLSAWLTGNTVAELVSAYLLKDDPDQARVLLDRVLPKETGHHTRAERRLLWANGHLFLAENKALETLRIAKHLLDSKRSFHETQPIPALLKLHGDALFALKQFKAAERSLEGAKQGAEQREALPLLWQIHAQLGWLYKEQKNIEKSEKEFASARQVLHKLAANIQEETLRASFLRAAFETLPKERKRTGRQSEAEKFEGLTPRELDVARLLSQGKSNREIAEKLVLSERTVENHVGNILAKLGFDSRAQIAVWAVEKGLAQKN